MKKYFILISIITISTQLEAHAYISPGSGSNLVQMIIGLFASIGYAFNNLIKKIFKKED